MLLGFDVLLFKSICFKLSRVGKNVSTNENKKKVTFAISTLGGGGAEGVCVNIANNLVERGWQVTLVVLNLDDAVHTSKLNVGVELIVVGAKNARYAFIPLFKCLKKLNPEIVIAFNYELTIVLQMLRGFCSLNYLLLSRNINSMSEIAKNNKGIKLKLYFFLLKYSYSKCDFIINQCNEMQVDLLNIIPSLENKSHVIYNPVNSSVEGFIAGFDFSTIEKKDYFLCIGRLEKQKAFHYAIKAFALVSNRHMNLRLKIIGKGSLEDSLKALADKLNVSDKVDFEGFQNQTIPYYLQAKATLLTSLYEGFPNVLIESISLGTPVIAYDCKSGPSEIITSNNGVLVKQNCVKSMASEMEKILVNESHPQRIRETSSKYRLNEVINVWESILEEFIPSKRT